MSETNHKQTAARLARVPLFSRASKKNLKAVAQLGKFVTWQEGRIGVAEGSRAAAFYLILSGTIEVVRSDAVVARLHEDDFFGESALLTGGVRNASVVAATDTELFALSKIAFNGVVRSNGDLALQLLAAMAERSAPR